LRIQWLPGVLVNELLDPIVTKDPVMMAALCTNQLISLEVFGVGHHPTSFAL